MEVCCFLLNNKYLNFTAIFFRLTLIDKMKIHYLQHVPFEGLGYIEKWAKQNGHLLSSTKIYKDEALPSINDFDWLIVMGGPMSVNDTEVYHWLKDEKTFIKNAIENDKVVLGICLGAQLIANALGSKVYQCKEKEIGWFPVSKAKEITAHGLADIFPDEIEVFHWHGETFDLPANAARIAGNNVCKNQAFVYNEKVIGLQFHLESTQESIEALIKNCSDEIVEAPYIQPAEVMLKDVNKVERVNKLMENILNRLIQK